MWIFTNQGMISIVAHFEKEGVLLVRSRERDILEQLFPDAKVYKKELADYRYRCEVDQNQVADVIAKAVRDIDYPNFKNSVKDKHRHDVYMDIWAAATKLEGVKY